MEGGGFFLGDPGDRGGSEMRLEEPQNPERAASTVKALTGSSRYEWK